MLVRAQYRRFFNLTNENVGGPSRFRARAETALGPRGCRESGMCRYSFVRTLVRIPAWVMDAHGQKLEGILSHAAGLFAERGFDGTSIRDIAQQSGVSLSGLYHYFKSKDELLYLIQKRSFETLLATLETNLDASADAEKRLRTLVRTHLSFFLSHMPEMKVISHEGASLPQVYLDEIRGLKRRYVDLVEALIRELRPFATPSEHRVATFALFGQLNWLYTWYRPGRDPSLDPLTDQMTGLLLHGIQGSWHSPT